MIVDSTFARPLPHNLEAERAILGVILLGGVGADDAIPRIQLTDFFLPQHQVIFRHLRLLRELGKPTNDSVLLYESLKAADDLEGAGGAAYLGSVPDGMPRVGNLAHYIEIVGLNSRLRRSAHTAEAIRELALGANGNAADVLQRIALLSAHLKEGVGQKRILKLRSGADIANEVDEQVDWIAPGYVAKGAITELGAKVKTGKTTLILGLHGPQQMG